MASIENRMDSDSEAINEMIINEQDGLPNLHPNYSELSIDKPITSLLNSTDPILGETTLDQLIHDEDLPTSLIVTNLDGAIFKNDELKGQLEQQFNAFGPTSSFQFLKSFRRLRVNYTCPAAAARARLHLHQTRFGDSIINCYFAQPVSPIDLEDRHLHPPAPTKQFLISPPASPPVEWAPRGEAEPMVNFDLLAAIAGLAGGIHELHPPSESQPGIVVHVCEEAAAAAAAAAAGGTPKTRIMHTRCPQEH